MATSEMMLLLAKETLLLVSCLVCLRAARRSTPAVRHLICLGTIAGSFAIVPTMFLVHPVVILHMPSIAGPTLAKSPVPSRWPWAEFAKAIWASGCALVMLRFLIGCGVLRRLKRSATPLGSGTFTADVSVPMVAGLLRPLILLPRNSAGWPQSQRNAAIHHELAHLKRGDLWANFAGVLACAVYWFHPLIWVLARRLRAEQEAACDDAVLEGGFDRVEYAEALVETARGAIGYPLLSCRMADPAGVKERVVRVLSFADRRARQGVSKLVPGAMVFVLGALSLVGQEQIYKVGDAVTRPAIIQKTTPEYTADAKSARIEGTVLLGTVIGSDGLAREIVVEQGIDKGLDQNAVEALRQWRLKPAELDGKPVAVHAKIGFNFRLR